MGRTGNQIAALIVETEKLKTMQERIEHRLEVLENKAQYVYDELTKLLERLEI